MIINSFEESSVTEFLFQEYNPVTGNGLAGRVSVIDAVSGVITNVTDVHDKIIEQLQNEDAYLLSHIFHDFLSHSQLCTG